MSTKEQDFKERFIAILENVRHGLVKDKEALWIVGSLATKVLDKQQSPTWKKFKSRLNQQTYSTVLQELESDGANMVARGKTKQAYAIQLMATSLVAATQQDKQVREGMVLLDDLLDTTVADYRRSNNSTPIINRPVA